MEEKKFIPLPIRIVENDFISEMFLLARILSENLQSLGVEVKESPIFLLDRKKKAAHIDIQLYNGNNAIVSIDAETPQGVTVYFFYEKKSETCLYTDFRQKKFLELVNMIKD